MAVGATGQLLLGAAAVPGAGRAGRCPLLERLRLVEGQCTHRKQIIANQRLLIRSSILKMLILASERKFWFLDNSFKFYQGFLVVFLQ